MIRSNFTIGDINGRYNSLLKESDYNTLKTCKTLDEIVVKLNYHFTFINEDMGYEQLREKFVNNVLYELKEFNMIELQYFIEFYMINSFFNKLDGIKEHVMGQFPELKTLELCKSFEDIQKLCINNCFLQKYFKNIDKYDRQKTMLLVTKNYMDNMYVKSTGYFREVLEYEGDRQILEICLNGKNLENKRQYFPMATTLTNLELQNLNNATDLDEIKTLLKIGDSEPIEYLIKKTMKIYSDSFCQFDDTACIYSYFKLKEQEIENIMWIVECILQDVPEKANEIILFE